jgi:cobalt-precorrin 5A hydrolase
MARFYVLGLGCERNCAPSELLALAKQVLQEAGVNSREVTGVFTIWQRKDEPAIVEVASSLGVPLNAFDAATLEKETPRLLNPSELVFSIAGCHGVAESAALAGTGPKSRLLIGKTKSAHATAALAVYDANP